MPKNLVDNQPRVNIAEIMLSQGYIVTKDYHYPLMFYAPGTTRDQMREHSVDPVVSLTHSDIMAIQRTCQNEQDVLIAIHSIATTGAMPDPLAKRIESAVEARTADLRREAEEARDLRREVAEMRKEMAAMREKSSATASPKKSGKASPKGASKKPALTGPVAAPE